MSDRTLALWAEFFRLEPWGNEWRRDAQVCELLSAQLSVSTAKAGGKYQMQTMSDFMPANWRDPAKKKRNPKRVNSKSIEAAKKTLAQMFGGN